MHKSPIRFGKALSIGAMILGARPAVAQSESHLRSYFEGKTVALKLEMPASDPRAGVPVTAYGATRLPPQFGRASTKLPLENLFNPFTPLADAST